MTSSNPIAWRFVAVYISQTIASPVVVAFKCWELGLSLILGHSGEYDFPNVMMFMNGNIQKGRSIDETQLQERWSSEAQILL